MSDDESIHRDDDETRNQRDEETESHDQPKDQAAAKDQTTVARHMADIIRPKTGRVKTLRALKELLDSIDLELPPEDEEDRAPVIKAPPLRVPTHQRRHSSLPPPLAKGGVWLVNALSIAIFFFAVILYLAPELIVSGRVGGDATGTTARQKELHPEWPLLTFETASGRKSRQIGRAVVSDTQLYDKVIETLSYHLVNGNKRVLCMWHLAVPISTTLTNVCVWKRRPSKTSIASLLFSQWQGIDEGLLLPMYNLDIKGFSLNATKTVTETSIMCGRSRLVARKRRPVVDISFETVRHWNAVRLLVDTPTDEESAFALQQAWEEARGYKCDHDY